MAEPQGQAQTATPAVGAGQTPGEPQVDPIKAQIEAALEPYKAELEKKKTEISGLDKKITELTKAVQAKDIEKMSAEDQAALKLAEANKKIEDANKIALELKKSNAVVSKGYEPDFAKLINGDTDDDIAKNLEMVETAIEKEVKKRVEKERNQFFGGQPPRGGALPTDVTLQSQLDEARKKGDLALATAIQRKASREGVTLKT